MLVEVVAERLAVDAGVFDGNEQFVRIEGAQPGVQFSEAVEGAGERAGCACGGVGAGDEGVGGWVDADHSHGSGGLRGAKTKPGAPRWLCYEHAWSERAAQAGWLPM